MYLVKRRGSNHWQLDLTFPKKFQFVDAITLGFFEGKSKRYVKSLGTADRAEAEIRAAPFVHNFRIAVFRWRKTKGHPLPPWPADEDPNLPYENPDPIIRTVGRKYPDGFQEIDGRQALVDGAVITFIGLDNKIAGKAENPISTRYSAPSVDSVELAESITALLPQAELPEKYQPKRNNPDEQLIEAYIRDKGLSKHIEADCRSTWALYKERIGKPLKSSTRNDGIRFAELLAEAGHARATITKKIGWLSAAVRHAIARDAFKSANPFQGVIDKNLGKREVKRGVPSEEDMAKLWAKLHTISPEDQLLYKLLAKTGLRLSEAMAIESEGQERGTGIRYLEVTDGKTEASTRRVPLPVDIGLPHKIDGPLFSGTTPAASKRLNRFLKDTLGANGVVVHSLRHRAADVFRLAPGSNGYLSRRILGHSAADVHESYGGRTPMTAMLSLINANVIDGSFKI